MDAQTSHDSLAVIFLWKERDFSKMSMLQIYLLKNISTKSMHLFSEEVFHYLNALQSNFKWGPFYRVITAYERKPQ